MFIERIKQLREEKARQEIDRKLDDAGWRVCNRDEFSPATSDHAVCEVIMQGRFEADYLLFINGKAIGVLEAKKDINSSSEQSLTKKVWNLATRQNLARHHLAQIGRRNGRLFTC